MTLTRRSLFAWLVAAPLAAYVGNRDERIATKHVEDRMDGPFKDREILSAKKLNEEFAALRKAIDRKF